MNRTVWLSRAIFTGLAAKCKQKKMFSLQMEDIWHWKSIGDDMTGCLMFMHTLHMEQIKWCNNLPASSSVFPEGTTTLVPPFSCLSAIPSPRNPWRILATRSALHSCSEIRDTVCPTLPLRRWPFLPLLINSKQQRGRLKGSMCFKAFLFSL